MSQANKGKYAEGQVQKWLEAFAAKRQDFDWERAYDAHSAGGRMQTVVGDFSWYMPGKHGVIEVKEVGHDYRLPHDRLTQKGKLRIRQMAGGYIMVMIYHTTTKQWRGVTLNELLSDESGASWDLRKISGFTYPTLDTAMSVFTWFPQ